MGKVKSTLECKAQSSFYAISDLQSNKADLATFRYISFLFNIYLYIDRSTDCKLWFILKEGDKWDERNLYTILTYSQYRTFYA